MVGSALLLQLERSPWTLHPPLNIQAEGRDLSGPRPTEETGEARGRERLGKRSPKEKEEGGDQRTQRDTEKRGERQRRERKTEEPGEHGRQLRRAGGCHAITCPHS